MPKIDFPNQQIPKGYKLPDSPIALLCAMKTTDYYIMILIRD